MNRRTPVSSSFVKLKAIILICTLGVPIAYGRDNLPHQIGRFVLEQPMKGTSPPRWPTCASCVKDEAEYGSIEGVPIRHTLNRLGLDNAVPIDRTYVSTYRGQIESFSFRLDAPVERLVPAIEKRLGSPVKQKLIEAHGQCDGRLSFTWTDGFAELVVWGFRKRGENETRNTVMLLQHRKLAAGKAKETPYGPPDPCFPE